MSEAPSGPERAARQVWRGARRFLTDPRTVGVARAGPRTVAFLTRQSRTSSAASSAADGSAAAAAGGPAAGGSAGIRPTAGLAAQVLLDEIVISAMRNPKLFPRGGDYDRAGDDMRAAHRLWEERGWCDAPESYHNDPPMPMVRLARLRSLNQRYEHLTFPSNYFPHQGEPGRDRWLDHVPNRTAHAAVLRHRAHGRPWLICVHGFGMGQPATDFRAFRARQLFSELGINLLLPVLPLHGARLEPGSTRGEGFMSIDLIDSVHGMTQAAWDVRSAIRWIRSQDGDCPIGIYGISLGGYVTALVASLEPDLACAIAGIPATDLPDLFRRHSPPAIRRKAYASGALGPVADAVTSVVSPLVLQPKLTLDRRFIFAGVGDRMSTPDQAIRLWEHWGRPAMTWYPGGHVGFFLAGNVGPFVTDALRRTGVSAATDAPLSPEPGPA